MVFSSLLFLYVFLPVTILFYSIFRDIKIKNFVLTIVSVVFYAWGEPLWIILLLFTVLLNYVCGRIIDTNRGQAKAKLTIIVCVILNLALLGVFKYLNFVLENIGLLIGSTIDFVKIGLPIGISFYTFQTLTYTIDLYRGSVKVQKSYMDLLLYVSLFPQLIAGPILRYSDVEAQLKERTSSFEKSSAGIVRFCCGLGKKVIIANAVGKLATQVMGGTLSTLPTADSWFGLLMYAFQIYFDFSGYSDMAIGLGKMFGFDYPENFRYPYIARSITEFWRSWHISLSTFFRDYVYIPLGGNRKHQLLNLLVVWALTGLWHGAAWNFVLWGLYYFVFLVIEKYILSKLPRKAFSIMGAIYTFPVVLVGWALFYYTDLSQLLGFTKALFGANGVGWAGDGTLTLWLENLPILVIAIVASTPLIVNLVKRIKEPVRLPFSYVYAIGMLFLSTQALVGQTYNPFIYFRF
jgi:alginate O-acetyltransferase complex protein AlgI